MSKMMKTLDRLLLKGETVEMPVYNHSDGSNSSFVDVSPQRVMILDGVMSRNPVVMERFPSHGIFLIPYYNHAIDGMQQEVFEKERGYTAAEVAKPKLAVDNYSYAYDKWIAPQCGYCDDHIHIPDDWSVLFGTL